jgi:hypothetical protein
MPRLPRNSLGQKGAEKGVRLAFYSRKQEIANLTPFSIPLFHPLFRLVLDTGRIHEHTLRKT